MAIADSRVDLGFTKTRFAPGTHLCLIYSDEKERREVMAKFLASGLAAGEKVYYFADRTTEEEVHGWLGELGVDLTEDSVRSRFAMAPAQSVYCPGCVFEPRKMLDAVCAAFQQARDEGCAHVRGVGEMSWALAGIPGSERLAEYEALLNEVLSTHPVTVICEYDANRFDGATLWDVLRAHPAMIVRGQVIRNPHYRTPQAFLDELANRP